MSLAACPMASVNANLGPHERAVQDRTSVRENLVTASLMRVAHRLFGSSVPKKLARRTGRSVRTAEYWLSGERDMDLGAFAALVSSDLEFFSAFMETVPAHVRGAWLDQQVFNARLAEAERKATKAAEELKQVRMEFSR
jgi:hypothetical protein